MSQHCKIGLIGGGQLGRMFIENALRYNTRIAALDPDPNAPCKLVAHEFLNGSLKDEQSLRNLAAISEVLSFEIEHVNVAVLKALRQEGKIIIPYPEVLEVIQDKGLQKEFYTRNQIPTSPYRLIAAPGEWKTAAAELNTSKVALKSRTQGYDGKGVQLANVNDPHFELKLEGPLVVEKLVEDALELAVMVAIDRKGNYCCYPVVEMVFDPEANLLDNQVCPARISEELAARATEIALKAALALNSPGIFAVELFLDKTGNIFVNEMAPRPHNSGHHTIEACYTSQYEQLLRILLDLPLGDTHTHHASAMINILGGPGFEGAYQIAGLDEIARERAAYLHMYDKAVSKPKRKLGHLTLLADNPEEALRLAAEMRNIVKIKAPESNA